MATERKRNGRTAERNRAEAERAEAVAAATAEAERKRTAGLSRTFTFTAPAAAEAEAYGSPRKRKRQRTDGPSSGRPLSEALERSDVRPDGRSRLLRDRKRQPVAAAVVTAGQPEAEAVAAAAEARADSVRRRDAYRAAAFTMTEAEAYAAAGRAATAAVSRYRLPWAARDEVAQAGVVAWWTAVRDYRAAVAGRAAEYARLRAAGTVPAVAFRAVRDVPLSRPDALPDVRPVASYVRAAARLSVLGPNRGLSAVPVAGWATEERKRQPDGTRVPAARPLILPLVPDADAIADERPQADAERQRAEAVADAERRAVSAVYAYAAAGSVPGYRTDSPEASRLSALSRYLRPGRTEAEAAAERVKRSGRASSAGRTGRPIAAATSGRLADLVRLSTEVDAGRLSWAEVAAALSMSAAALRMLRRRYAAALSVRLADGPEAGRLPG